MGKWKQTLCYLIWNWIYDEALANKHTLNWESETIRTCWGIDPRASRCPVQPNWSKSNGGGGEGTPMLNMQDLPLKGSLFWMAGTQWPLLKCHPMTPLFYSLKSFPMTPSSYFLLYLFSHLLLPNVISKSNGTKISQFSACTRSLYSQNIKRGQPWRCKL